MNYVTVCNQDDLNEGDWAAYQVEDREVLLVWPEDGELKAFNGLCPHQSAPLKDGQFDGKIIVCPGHQRVFDAKSGHAVHPRGCQMEEYPLKLENGLVQIELSAS